jgi:hypothetical protein
VCVQNTKVKSHAQILPKSLAEAPLISLTKGDRLTEIEKIQAVLEQMRASETQWLNEQHEIEQAKANHPASDPNTQTNKGSK